MEALNVASAKAAQAAGDQSATTIPTPEKIAEITMLDPETAKEIHSVMTTNTASPLQSMVSFSAAAANVHQQTDLRKPIFMLKQQTSCPDAVAGWKLQYADALWLSIVLDQTTTTLVLTWLSLC